MAIRAASPAVSENEFDISTALLGADALASDDEFGHLADSVQGAEDTRQVAVVPEDGFDSQDDGDEAFINQQQSKANRQGVSSQGKKAKGGSFQAMGLDTNVLKAIARKGFSIPTPIQRKAIPLILDGQDIVASARTGSGKTAAFVVPMIQRLKAHKTQVGARALILSPSRELALQTVKVTNELGKGTDLRTMLVVGGDSMEDQFKAMTSNPDIIIATPGRFLHLQIEMKLDMSSFRYVVFDEADRLFEMGFAAQLGEILHALPTSRQTLLFSATLPKSLVEFVRAGLSEPKLVRLDTDSKVSSELESAFFMVKSAEKEAALLHILSDVIQIPTGPTEASQAAKAAKTPGNARKRKRTAGQPAENVAPNATIVFTATKHHVEYITSLLRASGFSVSYLYSSLDQVARKINIQAFRAGQASILVVTDIAARGVDIPVLSNVINYDFASSAKLWVHRVGRTARAGRRGWSYNLVTTKDIPYMLDLQLFLSKRLVVGRSLKSGISFAEDFVVGTLQRDKVERSIEWVHKVLEEEDDISALRTVASKGEKLYNKSRNAASSESVKRAKEILASPGINEISLLFGEEEVDHSYMNREAILKRIRGFRPEETVFEVGKRGTGNETADLIKKARERMEPRRIKALQKSAAPSTYDDTSAAFEIGVALHGTPGSKNVDDEPAASLNAQRLADGDVDLDINMSSASEDELEVTFSTSNNDKRSRNQHGLQGEGSDGAWLDEEHFMSYTPRTTNLAEDRALSVHKGSGNAADFLVEARGATLDMGNDESKGFAEPNRARGMRWDKKSRKYVARANDEDGSRNSKSKFVMGEGGMKIAASFRSGRFDAWKSKNRMDRLPRVGEQEAHNAAQNGVSGHGKFFKHKQEKAPKQADKYRDDYHERKKRVADAKEKRVGRFKDGAGKNEIRSSESMAKERILKDKRREKNARPSKKPRR